MSPRRVLNQQLSNVDALAEEIKRRAKPEIKIQTPITLEEPEEPEEDFIIFYPPDGGRHSLVGGEVVSFDFWEGIARCSGGTPVNLSGSLQLKGKSAIYSLRVSSATGAFNVRINHAGVRTAYSGEFKIRGFPIRHIEIWSPTGEDLSISLMASTNADSDFSGGIRFQDSFTEDRQFLKVAPYSDMVAKGEVAGHIVGHVIGNATNTISTTAFVLLSNITAAQPTANTAMKISSTSVNDTAGGSGAQQVTLKYFEFDWGQEKTEVITLNGTNAVNLVNTNVYRINHLYINRTGSGGVAAGNIKLQDASTGTILYAQIDSSAAFFERATHYVSGGRICVISGAEISSSTIGGVIWRLFTTQEDSNGNIVPRAEFSGQVGANAIFMPLVLPVYVANPNKKEFQ